MAGERVFTDAPREFIARSVMDVVKLIFVAALVGRFFISASTHLGILSGFVLLIAFVLSVITLPRKEAPGKEA
jgi:hypothetical protein